MTENIDIDEEWDKEFHPKEETEKPIPKVTKEDIEFVIDTMAKEAKHDRTSIKQIFHGFNTGLTKTVLHGNLNSKNTGSGKSYLLNLVAKYYPAKYLLILQGASDKAFQHAPGTMVLEDKETGELTPTEPILNQMQLDIADLQQKVEEEKSKQDKKDSKVIKQLKEQISDKENEIKTILNKQVKLIILSDCITLFLDTPQEAITDNLMSILSNDTDRDQKYLFADKNASNKIGTKYNILRGTPVVFTTRTIDDTASRRFEEKNRRFVNITPNVSEEKIGDANNLMWQECGLAPEEYDDAVVSREDKERGKKIVAALVEKLRNHSKYLEAKQFGIKIPFLHSIKIPSNDVWSMTVNDRMRRYLTIITKENMDSRPRLARRDNPSIFLPISTFEDFKETLELMEIAGSNIRPYLAEWYNDKFLVAFKAEGGQKRTKTENIGETSEKTLTEDYVGVATRELCEITNIGSEELRKKYIDPLVNQGIINKTRSNIRKNENIHYPVDAKGQNIFSLFKTEECKLTIKPGLFPGKKLILEAFGLGSKSEDPGFERESSEKRFGAEGGIFKKNILDTYRLEDHVGKEITVNELIDRYLSDPETCFIKVEQKN